MPAPRYAYEVHGNALWVCLSCVWAIAALLAWLAVVGTTSTWETAAQNALAWGSPHARGSSLTLVALGVAATAFVLRLPILSNPPATSLVGDHVVWLLTACATVNWLGFIAFQVPTRSDLIPALLLVGVGEVWFHALVWRRDALPWLRQYCGLADAASPVMPSLGKPTVADGSPTAGDATASTGARGEFSCESQSTAVEPSPVDRERCDGVERKAVSGVDEQGKRYLTGEIKVSLAAEQSTEAIAIAFSPPFIGQPQVDFECEGAEEDVAVQLVHSSPSGMRLSVRRAASTDAVVFWLQWYAVEVELSASRDASPAGSRALP